MYGANNSLGNFLIKSIFISLILVLTKTTVTQIIGDMACGRRAIFVLFNGLYKILQCFHMNLLEKGLK